MKLLLLVALACAVTLVAADGRNHGRNTFRRNNVGRSRQGFGRSLNRQQQNFRSRSSFNNNRFSFRRGRQDELEAAAPPSSQYGPPQAGNGNLPSEAYGPPAENNGFQVLPVEGEITTFAPVTENFEEYPDYPDYPDPAPTGGNGQLPQPTGGNGQLPQPTGGNGGGDTSAQGGDMAMMMMMMAIPGTPGEDYPIYSSVPDTGFDCGTTPFPGIYADPGAECQVFYICQAGGQSDGFLCPNGTIFNQQYFVCDWWYNVACGDSEGLYGLNEFIYAGPEDGGFGERVVDEPIIEPTRPENGRPINGNGQRPQNGNGQRPQNGNGQRPQNGNGQRPQNGNGQRPQNGNGRPTNGNGFAPAPLNGGSRPLPGGQRPFNPPSTLPVGITDVHTGDANLAQPLDQLNTQQRPVQQQQRPGQNQFIGQQQQRPGQQQQRPGQGNYNPPRVTGGYY